MTITHSLARSALLVSLVLVFDPGLPAQQQHPDEEILVDLDVDSASLDGVLRMLARKYGLSLVVGPDIKGTVSAHFEGVSVQDALESLVKANGLELRRRGRVIEVVSVTPVPPEPNPAQEKVLAQPEQTQVYRLAYANADDMATSLRVLVEEGSVAANQANRSIVVTAPGEIQKRVQSVIDALDLPRRQVRIEAKILETVIGDLDALGIDWSVQAGLAGSRRPLTFPFDRRLSHGIFYPFNNLEGTESNVTTGDFSSTTTNASAFSDQSSFPLANREDFNFGSLDFTQFRAVLKALQQDTDTRIKGQPEITVAENAQARIAVGKTVPVPTYTRNEQYATTTVSGYEEIEVGTSLVVTPHINADGTISMLVTPEVSGILDFTGPFRDLPITFHRRAETEVTLEPGRTLVIGGLVSERTVERRSQVPLLGSIPLLGELFSYHSTQVEKTDLWIFITPRLVDPEAATRRAGGLEKVGDAWLPAAEASRLSRILSGITSPHPNLRSLAYDEALSPSTESTERHLGIPELAERTIRSDPVAMVRAAALRLMMVRWPERGRQYLDEMVDRRDVKSLPVLAAVALEEESLVTRATVLAAMARISVERARDLLVGTEKAAAGDARLRRARLECLDLLGAPSSSSLYRQALTDSDTEVVREALAALGRSPDGQAVDTIRAWLEKTPKSHTLFTDAVLALRDALGGRDRLVLDDLEHRWHPAPDPATRLAIVQSLSLERQSPNRTALSLAAAIADRSTAGEALDPDALAWKPHLRKRLQAALDLLSHDAPRYAELVRHALPRMDLAAPGSGSHLDAERSVLILDPKDLESWSTFDLAHQLVHEATRARCAAVGIPVAGPRADRLAFREQYLALRQLAGDPHPGAADIGDFLRKVERVRTPIRRKES